MCWIFFKDTVGLSMLIIIRLLSFNFAFYLCLCERVCMCVCHVCVVTQRQEESIRVPGAELTGSCELT